MSRGLHVATSLSMILLAISEQLLDNPANFVTAFGSSNDSESIIACQNTNKTHNLTNEPKHLFNIKKIINKNKTWSSEGVHRNSCISARISDAFFESDSMESETESRNLTSSATELSDWLIFPHSNAYKFGRKFPISASCVQLLLKFD